MINFLAKSAKTEKEKIQAAGAEALRRLGQSFYSLSIEDREKERQVEYQKLFPKPNGASISLPAAIPVSIQDPSKQEIPSEQFAPAPVEDITDLETTNVQVAKAEQEKKKKFESFSLEIKLNEKQKLLSDYVLNNRCCVLTGAAGTGKTTAVREVAKNLLFSGKLKTHTFKIKGTGEKITAPSVAFIAYTNRAAGNLAKAILKDTSLYKLIPCITTIHNLLEYEPEFFTIEDGEGNIKNTMRFIPKRTAHNPLDCTHIFIEESSQVGALDLYPRLFEACRAGTKIIFLGDINQLQPIFSPSILNYALTTLPVIELTEVYRQALDSPIIYNAHRCLRGESLETKLPYFRVIDGENLKKIPSANMCVDTLINSLRKWIDVPQELNGQDDAEAATEKMYDPEQDIILSPWNKGDAGTIAINNKIAQFLGQRRNAMVYEIIAGIRKLYLAEGDKVMYMKQDGIIMKINHNGLYTGKLPQSASTDLNRFGSKTFLGNEHGADEDFELVGYENLSIDSSLSDEDEEKRKQQTSHVVHIQLETGQKIILSTSGDFSESNFSLGYAITVHKAQGSEWRKVFILLHRNHAINLNRELLYTAITRARKYCLIVDLSRVLNKTISNQKIKGNSLEEKVSYFNSEISLKEPVNLIP